MVWVAKWEAKLATLDANHDAEHPIATSGRNGTGRVRKAVGPRRKKPTPLQTARWESGAEGKAQGTVHSRDRPRAGHTQRHREEVLERRESTSGAISTDAEWPMI